MDKAFDALAAPRDTKADPAQLMSKSNKSSWNWIAFVCLFVGFSGAIRYWRDWQFQSLSQESEPSPFPLSEFPKVLGNWQAIEGSEVILDPEVARIAGSSDHVIRTYSNERTGEHVSVMILYGLAYQVWPHTPEVCYPAAGFRSVSSPTEPVKLRTPDGTIEAPFRKQKFIKFKAGQGSMQEVYHSFRNAGHWGPDMQKNWKAFRYHPGMFKVQIQRQVSGVAASDESQAEQLLSRVVQEIERRLEVKS